MDTYPDDFRDHPDYTCLRVLATFSHQFIPESDLELRAGHKIEKFQREAACSSVKVPTIYWKYSDFKVYLCCLPVVDVVYRQPVFTIYL